MREKTFTRKIAVLAAALFIAIFINTGYACAKPQSFSPFERVATLAPVLNDDGTLNEVATYAKGKAVGKAIARYIDLTNEKDVLGFPSNWIVADADKDNPLTAENENTDDGADAILQIPSKLKIDSTLDPSPTNTRKISVIEICNKAYASKALGVVDIIPGVPIPDGFIHASALPCEISVHNNLDGSIDVMMLNAEAIFTVFFTDVVTSELMLDPDFAEQMMMLPGAVKGEMREMITSAISDYTDYDFEITADMAGPIFKNVGDVVSDVAQTLNQSPYVHFSYVKPDGSAFKTAEVKAITQTIMNTMSLHGEDGAGTHDEELDALLSPSSAWRSARHTPLGMPGANFVIEACSPKYAKMAISTDRLDHAPALPCEIALKAINGGTELIISFLDPNFMFDLMFKDMSDEEREAMLAIDLPGTVLNDLQTIVNYSFENDLEHIVLDGGEQVYYDMLPGGRVSRR
jgi:hypothetical protein